MSRVTATPALQKWEMKANAKKKAKGIRRMTPKQRRQLKSWAKTGSKEEYVPCARCRRWLRREYMHRHHRKPKGRRGTHVQANEVDLCGRCHRWTHEHPIDAFKDGYMESDKIRAAIEMESVSSAPLKNVGLDSETRKK